MNNGKAKKQDWRRPGVRVNMYFPDRKTLRELDRKAALNKQTRSEFVQLMLSNYALERP